MASELEIGSVATTGYVEAGTGVKLSATNGEAFTAVKYTAASTSWLDVLTINWTNASWAYATIQINLATDNSGGALELNVVSGHVAAAPPVTNTAERLGTDLSAYYQWVHTAGSPATSKLQINATGSAGSTSAIVSVGIARRPEQAASITWH